MATSNKTPVVIPQPIAAQATSENINAIPNGATGTNRASFQEGFPAITRMPVIENPLPTQVSGLPPKQQDFNGLFNVVSQHNFFAQNGGLYSFNQAVSDAIGGYPQGALLWAIVGGKPTAVYSLVENNTFNFLTNPEYLDGVHWAFIDSGLPTGTIITWASNNAPDGYLICNGAAVSRTTYARLFNVIGTTWGAGDGNTTFNLPNGGAKLWIRNDYPVHSSSAAHIKFKNLNTKAEAFAYGASQNVSSGWTVVGMDKSIIGESIGAGFPLGFGSQTGLYTDLSYATILKTCIKY